MGMAAVARDDASSPQYGRFYAAILTVAGQDGNLVRTLIVGVAQL
jgi:hypothetical protein